MTNGHPLQNAVAAQRDPFDAWRGIVKLVRDGHSPIDVSGISRSKAVLAADDILTRLAESDPLRWSDEVDHLVCYWCDCDDGKHAPDCLWLAARAAKGLE